MAAASPAELQTRATELGVDYLLMAEITELKASKPGGLTRVMKTTSGEDAAKDVTEAKLSVQLVPPGGKPRLSTNDQRQGRRHGPQDRPRRREVRRLDVPQDDMGGMYGSPWARSTPCA